MADIQYISQITLPSGNTYVIKDKEARELIAGGVHYRGVTTTALTDGSTTNPIQIGGQSYTAESGDLVIYQETNKPDREFIWNGSSWDEFGIGIGTLGALAFKNSAQGEYVKPTGEGSVSYDKATSFNGTTATLTVGGTIPTYESRTTVDLEVTAPTSKFLTNVTTEQNQVDVTAKTGYTGTAGVATIIDTTSFTQASLTTKNYGFSTSQEVLASATYNPSTETLAFGTVTAGTQDVLSNAEFGTNFYQPGKDTVFPQYEIQANNVVTSISKNDGDAVTSAVLFDGSTSGTISIESGVTTGEDSQVSFTGTYTPTGTITQTPTSATVTVATITATVTVE